MIRRGRTLNKKESLYMKFFLTLNWMNLTDSPVIGLQEDINGHLTTRAEACMHPEKTMDTQGEKR